MTTPKPASAPPADDLRTIVAEMREKAESLLGYSLSAASAEISEWCDRIEAIAASAQVREAEPAASASSPALRALAAYMGHGGMVSLWTTDQVEAMQAALDAAAKTEDRKWSTNIK